MPKSSLDDILEAQRIVNDLDKAGKRAILKILLKQDLEPNKKEPIAYKLRQDLEQNLKPEQSVTYKEGEELSGITLGATKAKRRKRPDLAERNRLNIKHGMYGTPTYNSWKAMRDRCLCPTAKDYHRYGERGIDIDPRWNSFLMFFADMGKRPNDMTIGRIDNNRGYWKDNCRWETPRQQANNRRSTRSIVLFGINRPIKEWATELKVSHQALRYRLKAGLTDTEIISIPLNHGNNFKERAAC